MYQELDQFLKSEEFEDELKKVLAKSNPNYLQVLKKRMKDIKRQDNGIVFAGLFNMQFKEGVEFTLYKCIQIYASKHMFGIVTYQVLERLGFEETIFYYINIHKWIRQLT